MMADEQQTTVRFGILGCASIAVKLCKAITLAPNATVVAIGSRSAEKAAKFAADNGLPAPVKVYGSYEEVLEDGEVDAVYVPLPTGLHVKWAVMAAERRKHVLLEKPVAMNMAEVDRILEACEANGVQFMDGTMWMHHPRTYKMKEVLSDEQRFGQLKWIHSCVTYNPGPEFMAHSIRVKPELDGLGALGDIGWYCIRAILWAVDYTLPTSVVAMPNAILNNEGVILSCTASLHWANNTTLSATFHCSFFSYPTFDLIALGTAGSLRLNDFVVPFHGEGHGGFTEASVLDFAGKRLSSWMPEEKEHVVECEEGGQEVVMVKEFVRLVDEVERRGGKAERSWGVLSRKTQLVVDAVRDSIERGYKIVDIVP